MCTVTFIYQEERIILTSNRDEDIRRPASLKPEIHNQGKHRLLYPKDPQGQGTWIAASDYGRVACLLNGAFEQHERQVPYRKSRGLVVRELFDYDTPEVFFAMYDLEGIEPFTLVIYEQKRLFEMRWDGRNKHIRPLSLNNHHIWSSATLYSPEIRRYRERLFRDWQAELPTVEPDALMQFHHWGESDPNEKSIILHRPDGLQTVSVSQIILDKGQVSLDHQQLLSREKDQKNTGLT